MNIYIYMYKWIVYVGKWRQASNKKGASAMRRWCLDEWKVSPAGIAVYKNVLAASCSPTLQESGHVSSGFQDDYDHRRDERRHDDRYEDDRRGREGG